MGTEDWILKGTKLITKTRKQIKNLAQKLDSQIYNIKETKQNHKHYFIYVCVCVCVCVKFDLKIGFFCKVIVDYKNEN